MAHTSSGSRCASVKRRVAPSAACPPPPAASITRRASVPSGAAVDGNRTRLRDWGAHRCSSVRAGPACHDRAQSAAAARGQLIVSVCQCCCIDVCQPFARPWSTRCTRDVLSAGFTAPCKSDARWSHLQRSARGDDDFWPRRQHAAAPPAWRRRARTCQRQQAPARELSLKVAGHRPEQSIAASSIRDPGPDPAASPFASEMAELSRGLHCIALPFGPALGSEFHMTP